MVEGNGRYLYEKGYDTGETDTILKLLKKYLNQNYSFDQTAKALFLNQEDQLKYRTLLNLQ